VVVFGGRNINKNNNYLYDFIVKYSLNEFMLYLIIFWLKES
jgi:hypothetical protein